MRLAFPIIPMALTQTVTLCHMTLAQTVTLCQMTLSLPGGDLVRLHILGGEAVRVEGGV